ncbi:hypothetical protein H5410_062109 [Solanum commersonii]|uniref:Uncharacterized protein n=1 Tax=Solanum commersonii TaxID=4109 RepID=A0A9J5WAJ9_SOLCO|nr:hypothetical protein H5410_062109 [Solanum commersonii]
MLCSRRQQNNSCSTVVSMEDRLSQLPDEVIVSILSIVVQVPFNSMAVSLDGCHTSQIRRFTIYYTEDVLLSKVMQKGKDEAYQFD